MKNKKDIFDLLKSLEDREQEINNLFSDSDFLCEEIDIVWEMIMDSYKVDGDDAVDILADFGGGNLTKTQTINRLRKLSNNAPSN